VKDWIYGPHVPLNGRLRSTPGLQEFLNLNTLLFRSPGLSDFQITGNLLTRGTATNGQDLLWASELREFCSLLQLHLQFFGVAKFQTRSICGHVYSRLNDPDLLQIPRLQEIRLLHSTHPKTSGFMKSEGLQGLSLRTFPKSDGCENLCSFRTDLVAHPPNKRNSFFRELNLATLPELFNFKGLRLGRTPCATSPELET
jgi:hypothetical protein